VWNERQREEATTLHGVPAANVAVTARSCSIAGSSGSRASRTRRSARMVGCRRIDRSCSTRVVGIHRALGIRGAFVRRWMATLRRQRNPVLRDSAILVRPHPFNCDAWERADVSEFGPVAVWPRQRYTPAAESSRTSFFDSLYYSAAVVGINTSAMIEAAILGMPVLSLMTGDFAGTQEGRCTSDTCCPKTAGSFAWHDARRARRAAGRRAARSRDVTRAQTLRFVRQLPAPARHGSPVHAILVEVFERVAAAGATGGA